MANPNHGGTSDGSGNDVATEKYPRAAKLVFSFILCESFCYMAMKILLLQYLTNKLSFKTDEAFAYYHHFIALSCFYSIVGHMVSISLPRFSTILISANIFLAGSLVLALTSIEKLGLQSGRNTLIGAMLASIGLGGIKSGVLNFAADQLTPDSQKLKNGDFIQNFYWIVNCAAFLAAILPMLDKNLHYFGQNNSFPAIFGLLAILILLAICVLLLGQTYNTEPIECLCKSHNLKIQTHSKYAADAEHVSYSGKQIFIKFLPHFLIFIIFWMLLDQMASTWVFQANSLKGNMLPEQVTIFNSIYVILLIYPISTGLRIFKNSPLCKITVGIFLVGLSFIVAGGLVKYQVNAGDVNITWMLGQFICLTLGEILVVVTGLEFIFSRAEPRLVAFLHIFWLLGQALGNLLLPLANCFLPEDQGIKFYIYGGIMIVSSIVFFGLNRGYDSLEIIVMEKEKKKD